jgi:hypothetical protein
MTKQGFFLNKELLLGLHQNWSLANERKEEQNKTKLKIGIRGRKRGSLFWIKQGVSVFTL